MGSNVLLGQDGIIISPITPVLFMVFSLFTMKEGNFLEMFGGECTHLEVHCTMMTKSKGAHRSHADQMIIACIFFV